MAGCTTRAIPALRGAPVPSIPRPWHIQRYSFSTASVESCMWSPSSNEPSRATRTPSSSTTSSVSRTTHRRSASAYRIVMGNKTPRWNMRRRCASYSHSSVVGRQRDDDGVDKGNCSGKVWFIPTSLHPVCVVFVSHCRQYTSAGSTRSSDSHSFVA
ncbi:hypothetical protein EDB84DRAFT_1084643 [Lactarius hengduanensis]|nr:hypothetical protein EDB84DRAFT_1084643 [Lactarius hengduanensis]